MDGLSGLYASDVESKRQWNKKKTQELNWISERTTRKFRTGQRKGKKQRKRGGNVAEKRATVGKREDWESEATKKRQSQPLSCFTASELMIKWIK